MLIRLLSPLRIVVLVALLVLVGPWALHATTPDTPPAPRESNAPTRVVPGPRAELEREMQAKIAGICARAMAAGATSCKEIDHDGP